MKVVWNVYLLHSGRNVNGYIGSAYQAHAKSILLRYQHLGALRVRAQSVRSVPDGFELHRAELNTVTVGETETLTQIDEQLVVNLLNWGRSSYDQKCHNRELLWIVAEGIPSRINIDPLLLRNTSVFDRELSREDFARVITLASGVDVLVLEVCDQGDIDLLEALQGLCRYLVACPGKLDLITDHRPWLEFLATSHPDAQHPYRVARQVLSCFAATMAQCIDAANDDSETSGCSSDHTWHSAYIADLEKMPALRAEFTRAVEPRCFDELVDLFGGEPRIALAELFRRLDARPHSALGTALDKVIRATVTASTRGVSTPQTGPWVFSLK